MYVKNMASFENITPSKLGSAGRASGNNSVKSFGDKSAYERFDRLGKAENKQVERQNGQMKTPAFGGNEQSETGRGAEFMREPAFPGSGRVISFPGGVKEFPSPTEKSDGTDASAAEAEKTSKENLFENSRQTETASAVPEKGQEEEVFEKSEEAANARNPSSVEDPFELSLLIRSLPKDVLLILAVLLLILSEDELSLKKLLSGEETEKLVTPLSLIYILLG